MSEDDYMQEALKPRPGFLLVAAVFAGLTVAAYLYEPVIIEMSDGSNVPFAVLLTALVLASIVMVLFYRNPRLGNRLLGYGAVFDSPDTREDDSGGYHFSGGFKSSDTATSAKRMNSRRKQARATRRQYAKVTREMQQTVNADGTGDTDSIGDTDSTEKTESKE